MTEEEEVEKENNLKLKISLKRKHEESSLNTITKTTIYPSPHRTNRKRKHIQNDQVLVSFLPIKIDQSIHKHENINTPKWTLKSITDRSNYKNLVNDSYYEHENLNDETLLRRHARYEQVEKTTRLLKPGVLNQLISESSKKECSDVRIQVKDGEFK